MKLDGENINIISIVIVKRLICFFSMAMAFVVNGYAQRYIHPINELSIELEIVSVSKGDYPPSPQGVLKGDTLPERIDFEFIVYNNSNKILIIGSNTRCYYYPKSYADYGQIGRFLMINGVDTIPLYTDMYYLHPNPHRSTTAIWGIIESSYFSHYPIFSSFMNRWADMAKRGENCIKGIYDYLKASRFVYVPIQADYQRRLDKFEDKSLIDCIIYPRKAIEVKKVEPFIIAVGYSEEHDCEYIYPPISIKQDE